MANITLYTDGTITFTSGSAAIVGTGTQFTSLILGDLVIGPDGKWYELAAIADATHATLNKNYAGATATNSVGGTGWYILKSSQSRDSVRTATKQLTDVSATYRQVTNLTASDQTIRLTKATTTDRSGLIVQKAGIDMFRVGSMEDDDFSIQFLKAATWTDAIAINKTTGAIALNSQLNLSATIRPPQLTAQVNDYAPAGIESASVVKIYCSSTQSLTGIAGGVDGRVIILCNVANVDITIPTNSTSSAAGNRIVFPDGQDFRLPGWGSVALIFDGYANCWHPFGTVASSVLGTTNTWASRQTFTNATEATGVGTTYSALFAGGVEIGKKLFVGGDTSVSGQLILGNGTTGAINVGSNLNIFMGSYKVSFNPSVSLSTGSVLQSLTNTGSASAPLQFVANQYLFSTGAVTIANTTTTTGSTSGALVVSGGIGVGGDIRVGGAIVSDGSAVISGNANIGGNIYMSAGTTVQGGNIASQFGTPLSMRQPRNNIEFGHSNTAGYGSMLGCNQSSGQPWLLFCGSAGTNANTFMTAGFRGSLLRPDMSGGFIFSTLASSNADNQSETQIAALNSAGQFSPASLSSSGSTLPVNTVMIATSKAHQFGTNAGSLYDQPKLQSEANVLFYNISSANWAGIGVDTSGHVWIRTGTSGTPAAAFVVRQDRTIAMPVYGAGTLVTNSVGVVSVSSDERLKIIKGEFKAGMPEVRKMRPVLYEWTKESGLADNVVYAGFGAQAMQKIIPEAVGKDSKGFLTLHDRPILAAGINAIINLDDRLSRLEATVAKLAA